MYYTLTTGNENPAEALEAFDKTVTATIVRGLKNLTVDATESTEHYRWIHVRNSVFTRLGYLLDPENPGTVATPQSSAWSMGSGGLHELGEVVRIMVNGMATNWEVPCDGGSITMHLLASWVQATEVP